MRPSRPSSSVYSVMRKPSSGIEVDRVLQLGREDVEVVEPLRLHALVVAVELQQPFALLHLEIELQRRAERVDRLQRAALIRHVDKGVAQPFRREERRGLVEVLVAARP